jgi:hypothetical protein
MNNKKLASALMTSVLTIALAGQALAAPIEYGEELKNAPQTTPYVSFTDLPQSHWAYSYIANMVQKKVLEGYVDNKFRAENTVTRAEFATIIVRASGIKPAKVNYASFSDVPTSNWASPFVESVKDYMTGYRLANGQYNFNPDTPATREDITVAIVKLKGYDTRLANRAAVEPMFKDFESVSESAKDYVAIAVKEGLVSGYPDETFRGQATITRAEASALLYRTFLYGNENKQVGGSSTTPTSPTSPTSPVTQPTTPPVTQPTTPSTTTKPSTPGNTQQPSQAAKFSVDTLVGGTGEGDVDGPVSVAKIKAVDSIITDKGDNIYFLDRQAKKVRIFNNSNGSVETFKTINSEFNWDSLDGKNVTHYDYKNYQPSRLTYSNANNKLYLLGYNSGVDQIFELTTTVHTVTYGMPNAANSNYRFFSFDDNNNFIFGSGDNYSYYSDSRIYNAPIGSKANLVASSQDKTGVPFSALQFPMEIMSFNGDIFLFEGGSRTLSKIHIFPRKIETIKTFSQITLDSITAYNGNFYISSGSTIYELTTSGNLNTFIDGNDLTYNDGNPIKKINQISFDSHGNVIIYDDQNKAIRRINL